MEFKPEVPERPPSIETTEGALRYVEELIERVETTRAACDVAVPSLDGRTAVEQQRRFAAFLIRHGHALGVIDAFLRAKLIGPVAYNQLVDRVRYTILPTMVGSAGSVGPRA